MGKGMAWLPYDGGVNVRRNSNDAFLKRRMVFYFNRDDHRQAVDCFDVAGGSWYGIFRDEGYKTIK